MKKFLIIVMFLMPISSVLGMQHIWDFNKDKPYWGVNREDAKCPGPHFESIWFKDFGHSILRYCIDNESKINLPSGGRARFVIINFQRENSITVGGPGYTSYSSFWKQVDCETGKWARSSGYKVENKKSEYRFPIDGKPGWFEFIYDNRPSQLKSLTPKYLITQAGPEERVFCKNM